MVNYDYLNIGGYGEVDLTIREEGKALILENGGKAVLRTTVHDFLSAPVHILKRFSSETDRYSFFRQFTFLSVLIGFPITLYLLLYTFILFLLCRLFDLKAASVGASILCFSAGIFLLTPLILDKPGHMGKKALLGVPEPGPRRERVSAEGLLKRIEESDKWYDQWRAYRALRALGWKQTRLR